MEKIHNSDFDMIIKEYMKLYKYKIKLNYVQGNSLVVRITFNDMSNKDLSQMNNFLKNLLKQHKLTKS